MSICFFRNRGPPRSTRTYPLFPHTTLCRSQFPAPLQHRVGHRLAAFEGHGIGGAGGRDAQFVEQIEHPPQADALAIFAPGIVGEIGRAARQRSEEHTSELQSLMRTSYAVLCLKKKQTR